MLRAKRGEFPAELAPAFDNGTSLAYEILEEDLPHFSADTRRIVAYVNRGTHHMKWDLDEDRRLNHAELFGRFVREYPSVAPLLRNKLSFSQDNLRRNLTGLTDLQLSSSLSRDRLEFMIRLITVRQARLAAVLDSGE